MGENGKKELHTAQKIKLCIKDFICKFEQICRELGIFSHLLKKSLMGKFSFHLTPQKQLDY